jgi:hypothetical protein
MIRDESMGHRSLYSSRGSEDGMVQRPDIGGISIDCTHVEATI